MDARHLKLQDVCNKYGDPMIPEYMMQSHVPPSTSFVIYPKEKLAFCGLSGVAKTGFTALFDRIRQASDPDTVDYAGWHQKETYQSTNKKYKKAIFVRHPMERLISVYRYEYILRHFNLDILVLKKSKISSRCSSMSHLWKNFYIDDDAITLLLL